MSAPRPSQPRRWQPLLLKGLLALLLGGGVSAALVARSVLHRSEDALRRVPPSLVRYKLRAGVPVTLGAAAREGVGLLTAPAEARDGLTLDDPTEGGGGAATLVATAGGLLLYRGSPDPLSGALPPPRLYSHLDGLSSVSLRAAAALPGNRVVLGDSEGGLTLLQRDRATALRLDLRGVAAPKGGAPGAAATPGPIIDLLPAGMNGDILYILVQDLGLLAWDPATEEVIDVGRSTGVDLRTATALCSGAAGLAVGTAEGRLLREHAGKMTLIGTVPERVTALSCTGPRVYVGTPLGLYATSLSAGAPSDAAPGPLTLLRADLFVTALLDNGLDQGAPGAVASLVVGTFDDGVLRFESSGQRLRQVGQHIPRRRVLRLRPAAAGTGRSAARIETVLAFTTQRTYRLQPGAPEPLPLPLPAAALAGPHVTALVQDGRARVWAGTFENGVELLELAPGEAKVLAHRPLPSEPGGDNINALVYRAADDEVLAATVRGVDRYSPDERQPRRLGPEQGLLGDQVQALALLAEGGLAVATSRGLSLVGPGGVRSLYAFHGLAANRVYSLLAQGSRLYVGTLAGLSIVEKDRVVHSHTPASTLGLGAGWVSALAACEGEIFIGTYGGGLSALLPRTGGALAPVAREERRGAVAAPGGGSDAGAGEPSEALAAGRERVAAVAGAREPAPVRVAVLPPTHVNPGALLCEGGQLYIGTLGAGLWRLDPRSRAAVRLAAPLLPSQSVTALGVARAPGGPLFLIGTEAGLLWLTPERLRDAARGAGEIL